MAVLTIEGREINIDDGFLKLSPEKQNETVGQIAQSLKIIPAPTAPKGDREVPLHPPPYQEPGYAEEVARGLRETPAGPTGGVMAAARRLPGMFGDIVSEHLQKGAAARKKEIETGGDIPTYEGPGPAAIETTMGVLGAPRQALARAYTGERSPALEAAAGLGPAFGVAGKLGKAAAGLREMRSARRAGALGEAAVAGELAEKELPRWPFRPTGGTPAAPKEPLEPAEELPRWPFKPEGPAAPVKAPPRPGAPEPPSGSLEERVRDAYTAAGGTPRNPVTVADLRQALPDVPKADLDAALQRMHLQPGMTLSGSDNPAGESRAVLDAAVDFKGLPKHRLWITARSPKGGEAAPVKEGFTRFYHGGLDPTSGGGRWLTPDVEYARNWGGAKPDTEIHYVDIPERSPLLRKAFEDQGTSQKAPYVSFEAPEDIAKQLKPLGTARPGAPAPPPGPWDEGKVVKDFSPIDRAVANTFDLKPAKGKTLDLPAQEIRNELSSMLREWKALDPYQYHTVAGLDELSQKLRTVRDAAVQGSSERQIVDTIHKAVQAAIAAQSGKYAKAMQTFEAATDRIRTIERALETTNSQTTLQRLQKVLGEHKDTVTPSMLEDLATQAVKIWAKKGLGGIGWELIKSALRRRGGALSLMATLPFASSKLRPAAQYEKDKKQRQDVISRQGSAFYS